jgi:lipopolysaccharide transport system ATP-binding protein
MPQAIVIENLTKCYQLGEARHTMVRDAVVGGLRKLFGGKASRPARKTLWALNGVSLGVEKGEVIGLIGRNGAGKSTLLKILSRITHPTSGRVDVQGRVASLLEVGTGFHDELTGRENIYLNGSILGMRKREIDGAIDQIVDFANIGDFLDTPIKRYSSGMRMRLGFSVAAHLRTDVLFVDEVLAVGDAAFQKKCLGAMRELSDGGRTVVFVSHNMAAVENLCKRTVWIANGTVAQDGPTKEVIRAYLNSFEAASGHTLDLADVRDRRGSGEVRFTKLEILPRDDGGERVVHSGDPVRVRLHYECHQDVKNLYFAVELYSNLGLLINSLNTYTTNQAIPLAKKGKASIDLEIDFLNLMPGTYYAGIWAKSDHEHLDWMENVTKLNVEPSDFYGTGRGIEARFGLVFFPFRWTQLEGLPADQGDELVGAAPPLAGHDTPIHALGRPAPASSCSASR